MSLLRKLQSLCLILILAICHVNPIVANAAERQFPSGGSYENIGTAIKDFVDQNLETTAGMEVAVFDASGIIYQQNFGYADKENQILADENTVFEWGSVSKILIWTSVMQLYEQGLIDLDTDISNYLPNGFLSNRTFDKTISMKNLMNHNAGFQEMISDLFVKDSASILSLKDALLLHQPAQIYEPGTVTAYSNWSTALAAYIVECISGIPYSEYVNEHIFAPLHMEHTAIAVDLSDNEWVKEQRKSLQCYTAGGNLIKDCFYYIPLYPAGMCTGTLSDFALFAQALLPTDGNKTVLFQNRDTLDELLSPTNYYGDTNIPVNCHGLWYVQFQIPVLTHGGNTAGCSSGLFIDPDSNTGLVVMTNQQNETVYNAKMPELVFGKFENSALSDYNTTVPSGFYRSARTILKGPLSVYGCSFYVNSEDDLKSFWVYDQNKDTPRIADTYTDMLKISTKELIVNFGLLLAVAIGFVYSIITLVAGGCIVTPLRKKKAKRKGLEAVSAPLRAWNYTACGLQLLFLLNILLLVYRLITYAPSSQYLWQFCLCGAIGIAMIGLFITLLIKWKSLHGKTKIKVKYGFTAFFLLTTVFAILYWQMYAVWAL